VKGCHPHLPFGASLLALGSKVFVQSFGVQNVGELTLSIAREREGILQVNIFEVNALGWCLFVAHRRDVDDANFSPRRRGCCLPKQRQEVVRKDPMGEIVVWIWALYPSAVISNGVAMIPALLIKPLSLSPCSAPHLPLL
jgi:hypothetical protein